MIKGKKKEAKMNMKDYKLIAKAIGQKGATGKSKTTGGIKKKGVK